jgi:hypothetical protein
MQDEHNMSMADAAFLRVLSTKNKVSKDQAHYSEDAITNQPCEKCKFNLGDEEKCHVVEGRINNERGTSKYFSSRGDGMLPGDIVWYHIKRTDDKLSYGEGYVISEGAKGFQCKDCKYFLYSGNCLLIKGKFRPEMSCGFIVKVGHGTEV